MAEPMFLKPYFQEKMWGGDKLATEFGYQIPSDHTGECWAISAHPHGPATVENGKYKGPGLERPPGSFWECSGGCFSVTDKNFRCQN